MYSTLRSRIEALPDGEFAARRALYTDDEWNNSWELNAFDHQLWPMGDDWTSWTVIAGRRTGKTTAGKRWIQSKMHIPGVRLLVMVHHPNELSRVSKEFWDDIVKSGNPDSWRMKQDVNSGNYRLATQSGADVRNLEFVLESRTYQGFVDPHYLWADEVTDATLVMHSYPLTKQFCFTEPVKLAEGTIVSQAGKGRVF